MPIADAVPAETGNPDFPTAWDGTYMICGGAGATNRWVACRFVLAPAKYAWRSQVLMDSNDRGYTRLMRLGADGGLRYRKDKPDLPPLGIMIFPRWENSGEVAAHTIMVEPDALDMLGIRATVPGHAGGSHDIQSPAGRRELAEKFQPGWGIARAVANWAAALGERDLDQLPPRLGAGLMVERIAREEKLTLPGGVTPDGLGRWRLAQRLRAELEDERSGDRRKVALMDLIADCKGRPPARAMTASAAFDDWIEKEGIREDSESLHYSFAALTGASADTVFCARSAYHARLDEFEANAQRLGWRPIDEEWTRQALSNVGRRMKEHLRRTDDWPPMRFLARVDRDDSARTETATDMVLVPDRSTVHAFGWPTAERRDTLFLDNGEGVTIGKSPLVSAAEIPSMEEVQDLAVRVRARRQEARHESEARPAALPAPAM